MKSLAGTRRLVKLALRRDRIVLPAWIIAITALTAGVTASIHSLYQSEAERAEAGAFSAANTAARVIDGPASGSHIGALTMLELYTFLAVLIGLMSIQAVVRHTRQNEDAGRTELLASTPLGRHAQLTAALIVTFATNVLLSALVTGVLLFNDLDSKGAILAGCTVGAMGMVFAGIAAVSAQVMSSQRGATTVSVVALGAAFLLRSIGDAFGELEDDPTVLVSSWPTWLSPIGWAQQVRPFYQDNADVFFLFGGLVIGLLVMAYSLVYFRDIGGGIFSTPAGPPHAPKTLRSPLGLSVRLHRGGLIGWAIGVAIIGAVFGAVGDSADDIVGMSEQIADLLVGSYVDASLVDLYFAFVVGFLGIAATGYTIQAILRARTEETSGHIEPVLAASVSRVRWINSHLLVTALGSVLVLGAMGLAGVLAYAAAGGDVETGVGMFWASMAQAPAMLLLGGVALIAFAFVPRWAPALAWSALALCLVLSQFGDLLELPQMVINISPFTHVSRVPAESYDWTEAILMMSLVALMVLVSLFRFRRRDVLTGA